MPLCFWGSPQGRDDLSEGFAIQEYHPRGRMRFDDIGALSDGDPASVP
jgi:hypothetical protein